MRFKIESQYYYETTFICIEDNTTSIIKKARKKFFSKYSILLKISTLKKITLDLDIIINKLDDLTYNKYSKIVRRIMFVLYIEILISKSFAYSFC